MSSGRQSYRHGGRPAPLGLGVCVYYQNNDDTLPLLMGDKGGRGKLFKNNMTPMMSLASTTPSRRYRCLKVFGKRTLLTGCVLDCRDGIASPSRGNSSNRDRDISASGSLSIAMEIFHRTSPDGEQTSLHTSAKQAVKT